MATVVTGGYGGEGTSSGSRADVCFFVSVPRTLVSLLPLVLPPLRPQWRFLNLRRREGQTVHYGLRKILRCAATKTTLITPPFFFRARKGLLALQRR
jgi:hypothetical protein